MTTAGGAAARGKGAAQSAVPLCVGPPSADSLIVGHKLPSNDADHKGNDIASRLLILPNDAQANARSRRKQNGRKKSPSKSTTRLMEWLAASIARISTSS